MSTREIRKEIEKFLGTTGLDVHCARVIRLPKKEVCKVQVLLIASQDDFLRFIREHGGFIQDMHVKHGYMDWQRRRVFA